jgi:acetyl esterase/lipase
VADLRLLDALQGGSAAQRAWRGGNPLEVPERWAAASPATRADRVRTPLLLVYGQNSMGLTHGLAWFTALRDHGVPCELVVYDGEGHLSAGRRTRPTCSPGQPPGFVTTRQAPDSQIHPPSRVTGHQGLHHPAAFLLVTYGRSGPLVPALRGRITASGRKPRLGLRLPRLFRRHRRAGRRHRRAGRPAGRPC